MFSALLAVAASVMVQAGSPPPSEPAAAPPAAQVAPLAAPLAAQADKAPKKDPVICHQEMPLGSRLPQKVCARRSAAEQQERDSRRTLEDIQTRSRGPFATRE